jgi:hypothetical protein
VAFLFELYQKYTSLFPAEKPAKRRKKGWVEVVSVKQVYQKLIIGRP